MGDSVGEGRMGLRPLGAAEERFLGREGAELPRGPHFGDIYRRTLPSHNVLLSPHSQHCCKGEDRGERRVGRRPRTAGHFPSSGIG